PGCQTNLQPRSTHAHAKLGPHCAPSRVLNEWTLELADKEIRKLSHENPRGTPATDVTADDQEPQRRDDDGGAKPSMSGVDIQVRSKGNQTRLKDILDRGRNIGRRSTGGWFDSARRPVDLDPPHCQPPAWDRLLEDARAPSGTNAVVLRLGN